MEEVPPGVGLGVSVGVGLGIGVEVALGVGVGVCEVGVKVGVAEATSAVKLSESRYNVPFLWARLSRAIPLMAVAVALRSDKGIVYTFQVPGTGSPP